MSVLRYTPLFALGAWSLSSFAVGLGPLNLESGLGQPLRATIPVFEPGKNIVSPRCVSARVESFDGSFISNLQVEVPDTIPTNLVTLSSRQIVNEPAITVFIEFDCGSRIRRSYQSLLDFPSSASTLATVEKSVLQRNRSNSLPAAVPVIDGLAADSGQSNESGRTQGPPRQQAFVATQTDSKSAVRRPPASVSKKDSTAGARPVLKLSSDANPLVSRLKMSDVLTLPSGRNAVPPDAPTDEMRAARQAFSAMLRDENFLQNTTKEVNEAQRKLLDAQTKASTLAKQNESNRLAYVDLEQKSFSTISVAVLSGMLLFSIGTIGLLAHKLRRAKRSDSKWWEGSNQIDDPIEPTKHSLFASTTYPDRDDVSSSFNMAAIDQLYARAGDERKEPTDETYSSSPSALEFANSSVLSFQSTSQGQGAYDDAVFPHTVGGLPLHQGKLLKVEEVSDVVQEAEFWMLLNDPQRAVQILEPHASSERPDSPVAWLYLIDLYRILGDRDKYMVLSDRFKRIFNARIPKWEEQSGETETTTLEDFPGLLKRIVDVWNDHERIIPFLESLLIDDRDGERIGFDLPVYREIIMLIGIANETTRIKLRQ